MQATGVKRAELSAFPWWVALVQGIASFILGILLLISPGVTTLLLIQFLGIYWLIQGIFSIVRIFTGDRDIHWGWLLLSGILGVIAGIVVINNPLWSTILVPTVLVILLAVQGFIMGIISFIEGFTQGPKWGAIILGAISMVFSVILFFSPLIAATMLPFLFGIIGIAGGVAAIFYAFRLRNP